MSLSGNFDAFDTGSMKSALGREWSDGFEWPIEGISIRREGPPSYSLLLLTALIPIDRPPWCGSTGCLAGELVAAVQQCAANATEISVGCRATAAWLTAFIARLTGEADTDEAHQSRHGADDGDVRCPWDGRRGKGDDLPEWTKPPPPSPPPFCGGHPEGVGTLPALIYFWPIFGLFFVCAFCFPPCAEDFNGDKEGNHLFWTTLCMLCFLALFAPWNYATVGGGGDDTLLEVFSWEILAFGGVVFVMLLWAIKEPTCCDSKSGDCQRGVACFFFTVMIVFTIIVTTFRFQGWNSARDAAGCVTYVRPPCPWTVTVNGALVVARDEPWAWPPPPSLPPYTPPPPISPPALPPSPPAPPALPWVQNARISDGTSTALTVAALLVSAAYAACVGVTLRRTGQTLRLSFEVSYILFSTTADILLDILYATTAAYSSYTLWYLSMASIITPNICMLVGTGALRQVWTFPWGSYAWHLVRTIRGRKPWGTDSKGNRIRCRIGLAISMEAWDKPLAVLGFAVYLALLRPLLSLLLFVLVYAYIFLLRPLLCLLALVVASNLRLAVFPKLMESIVNAVKSPPNFLFGVDLREIDPNFEQRLSRMEGKAATKSGSLACVWAHSPDFSPTDALGNRSGIELQSEALAAALEKGKRDFTDGEFAALDVPLPAGQVLSSRHFIRSTDGRYFTPLVAGEANPIYFAAYRWNLTLTSEVIFESIPQLALMVINEFSMAALTGLAPAPVFWASVASSAMCILFTLWPIAFWLIVGLCVEGDKSLWQALEVPIFPHNALQQEQRRANQERIKFLKYNSEASTSTMSQVSMEVVSASGAPRV